MIIITILMKRSIPLRQLFTSPIQPWMWKIVLPESIIQDVLKWYHLVLGHCGYQRLYNIVGVRFHSKQLEIKCRQFHCTDNCHQYQNQGRGYGFLLPREANAAPWNKVTVDSIGPWTVTVNHVEVEFKALTCMDPVTNLTEAIRINNKTSLHMADQFRNYWLSQYPKPNKCIHDNGGKLIDRAFLDLLRSAGIQSRPTTVKNMQSAKDYI